MALKNYTTKISSAQTLGEIQQMLSKHGAKRIMVNYNDKGSPDTVMFDIEVDDMRFAYKLDSQCEGVKSALRKDSIKFTDEQAMNIAWRNIKDWIAAQLALVESNQQSVDEAFFAKLINKEGNTIYNALYECGSIEMLPQTFLLR